MKNKLTRLFRRNKGKHMYQKADGDVNVAKIVWHSVIGLFLVICFFGSFGTIGAGERGVKTKFGAVTGVLEQGLYFKLPFFEKVHKMDVKTRTINYDKNGAEGDSADSSQLFGASKDLQDVQIGVVVNYHLMPEKAGEIFSSYSSVDNYESNVIEPVVREVVKSTSAQFTAEELVTRRAEFSDKVNSTLTQRFADKDSILERFSVTNFEFSKEFSKAIEAKVTATQNAEAAKNKLEQIKFEAQQVVETAKATAEAQRISSAALAAQGGSDYVQLQAINKWNGVLPTSIVPGSAVPFLNLNK